LSVNHDGSLVKSAGNAIDIEWSIVGEFAVTPKFNEKDIA
jgi:hypothetical protein